jgi:predicted O-methyltransferase YrrM
MLTRLLKDSYAHYQRGAPGRANQAALRRLRRRLDCFAAAEAGFVDAVATLREPWQAYVTSVSPPAMAASLEVCVLLLALARAQRATRVLDLGSGFSSFVTRTFVRETGSACRATSVDDSGEWLGRTRVFLRKQGLETDDMLTWETFRSVPSGPYDLVFHDLGDMPVRAAALPYVLGQVAAGGIVVLDDMHKSGYPEQVRRACGNAGFDLYPVPTLTTDAFGRFAVLALPH